MTHSAFSTFGLTRGLSATLFKAKRENIPEMMDVGSFKGWIKIKKTSEEDDDTNDSKLKNIMELAKKLPDPVQQKLVPFLELYSMFKLDNMFANLEKEISLKQKCIVRLYIIEAYSLSSRDLNIQNFSYIYIFTFTSFSRRSYPERHTKSALSIQRKYLR